MCPAVLSNVLISQINTGRSISGWHGVLICLVDLPPISGRHATPKYDADHLLHCPMHATRDLVPMQRPIVPVIVAPTAQAAALADQPLIARFKRLCSSPVWSSFPLLMKASCRAPMAFGSVFSRGSAMYILWRRIQAFIFSHALCHNPRQWTLWQPGSDMLALLPRPAPLLFRRCTQCLSSSSLCVARGLARHPFLPSLPCPPSPSC